jgi:hypothetical protein
MARVNVGGGGGGGGVQLSSKVDLGTVTGCPRCVFERVNLRSTQIEMAISRRGNGSCLALMLLASLLAAEIPQVLRPAASSRRGSCSQGGRWGALGRGVPGWRGAG